MYPCLWLLHLQTIPHIVPVAISSINSCIAFLSCNPHLKALTISLNKYHCYSPPIHDLYWNISQNKLMTYLLISAISSTAGCDVKWLCNCSILFSGTVIAGTWPLVLQANSNDGKTVCSQVILIFLEVHVKYMEKWKSHFPLQSAFCHAIRGFMLFVICAFLVSVPRI